MTLTKISECRGEPDVDRCVNKLWEPLLNFNPISVESWSILCC